MENFQFIYIEKIKPWSISEPPTNKKRRTVVPQRNDPFEIIFSEPTKADNKQPPMSAENKLSGTSYRI